MLKNKTLTWRDVLDVTKVFLVGGYMYDAALLALSVKYEFFNWNGRIYRILTVGENGDELGCEDTGILEKDVV